MMCQHSISLFLLISQVIQRPEVSTQAYLTVSFPDCVFLDEITFSWGWGLGLTKCYKHHLHHVYCPSIHSRNGPAAWRMEAGLLASPRCDLERHGAAGRLWPAQTPGPSRSSAPRTGLCCPTLHVWEVKHTCSLCSVKIWAMCLGFTGRAIVVSAGLNN